LEVLLALNLDDIHPEGAAIVKLFVHLAKELPLMLLSSVFGSKLELFAKVLVKAVRYLGLSAFFIDVCNMTYQGLCASSLKLSKSCLFLSFQFIYQ